MGGTQTANPASVNAIAGSPRYTQDHQMPKVVSLMAISLLFYKRLCLEHILTLMFVLDVV